MGTYRQFEFDEMTGTWIPRVFLEVEITMIMNLEARNFSSIFVRIILAQLTMKR